MENNVNIAYQVMGRQKSHKTSYMRIYKEKYIQTYLVISLNKSESNRI